MFVCFKAEGPSKNHYCKYACFIFLIFLFTGHTLSSTFIMSSFRVEALKAQVATKKFYNKKIIQHIHSSFPSDCIQYKLCHSYRPKGAEVTNP